MPPETAVTPTTRLEAIGIEAGYGSLQVLWGVDLQVGQGETIVLLGANGAGKTTFLKALLGLVRVSSGTIRFDGENLTRMRTDQRVRRGLAFMSEIAVFQALSIEENIRIGAQTLDARRARARADELYAIFPILKEKRRAAASSLSGGQRKMLGIAKALAADPQLLIMDEPSAGLSPLFVREVVKTLSDLRTHGLSLLIAEQNVSFLDVADRVFVLEGGRIGFAGLVSDLRQNDALARAYFGLK
ncbi:MAG: branched-chain amino acid transport system ATP-binding protein [Methylobacteriaceae bacterium]|jgi:branched-chain amino acid transport system ATP-binding protein|nr:branched-chain amino acid transport system ATP-binding protein [Methylobacteriaceae bacterium]